MKMEFHTDNSWVNMRQKINLLAKQTLNIDRTVYKEQLDIKFAFVSRSDGLGAGLKHLF